MPNPGKSLRLARESVAHLLPTDTCKTDPDLAAIVGAWPALPEAIREGILAIVKAARPQIEMSDEHLKCASTANGSSCVSGG
jgi:hypothetical protein